MNHDELMKLRNDLLQMADLILFVDRFRDLPSCNDCAIKTICPNRPAWGDPVRYNCYGWKPERRTDERPGS